MVNEIKSAIVSKLKELYPNITRYTDDNVPQNFSKPSFFVSVYDMEYEKRLNNKYKGSISFDLAYFSGKGLSEIKSDCLTVQVTLLRGFDFIGTFKAINKKVKITDNVLHLTFDVAFSEMITEEDTKMQTQTYKINI